MAEGLLSRCDILGVHSGSARGIHFTNGQGVPMALARVSCLVTARGSSRIAAGCSGPFELQQVTQASLELCWSLLSSCSGRDPLVVMYRLAPVYGEYAGHYCLAVAWGSTLVAVGFHSSFVVGQLSSFRLQTPF